VQLLDALQDGRAGRRDRLFTGGYERWAAGALTAASMRPSGGDTSATAAEGAWANWEIGRLSWLVCRRRVAAPVDAVRLESHRLRHELSHLGRRLATLSQPDRLAHAARA
jgi:hypothetical protein